MEKAKQRTSETVMKVKGIALEGTSNGRGSRGQYCGTLTDLEREKKSNHP